ncbi:MAG TPA: hypothetical protein VFW29_06260, partial [Solirubrobacteraceae bacterium]|nr:hypothetical protein [Solirubrobacteraceae bacterium]
ARLTVTDMVAQSAVSLLNLAARRLAPAPPQPGAPPPRPTAAELEQARDGIDAVRALLEILERRIPQEVAALRDALSQLQLAYASHAQAAGPPAGAAEGAAPDAPAGQPGAPGEAGAQPEGPGAQTEGQGPGPAESSGRLWVPGR